MSEAPKIEGEPEPGRTTKASLVTQARRIFGAVAMFAGGGVASIAAEEKNWPVVAGGVAVTALGALLAGIDWVSGKNN